METSLPCFHNPALNRPVPLWRLTINWTSDPIRTAYLNWTFITSALPHAAHSKVRTSWSVSSAGSMRARCVIVPHFEQSGRYNWT